MPLNRFMVIVPALGHDYDEIVTAPTCTKEGYTTYICVFCDDEYVDNKVAATGHTYTNGKCSCGAINYGTLENPVSTSDALGACGSLAEGKASADLFYVTGIVTKIGETGSYYKNVYITDGKNELLIYSISMGEGVTGFEVGDIIIAYGYIKNYYGVIEMASNNGKYVYAVSAVDPCADGHHYLDATCTEPKTCKYCKVTEGETIDHNYVNSVCTVCGATKGVTYVTVGCDFSKVSGTQYADETKSFGDVTVSTHNKGCHFNTQLRIYDSSSNNGYAVITASGTFTSLDLNMGYKKATLNVYGSVDGETWVLIEAVATTTTSYKDYSVDIDESLGYKYLKIDASGAQIRVASLSVTYQA